MDTMTNTTRIDAVPAAAPWVRPSQPGRVLLLRRGRTANLEAHRWARRLARAIGAELMLVRLDADPVGSRRSRLRPARDFVAARARWQRRFGEGVRPYPTLVLPRLSHAEVAEALGALSPQLVVLSSAATWPGDSVARLATQVGAPFLVARRAAQHGGVLAATDLSDARLPVLDEGARWAGALGAALTCVHNRAPAIEAAPRPAGEGWLAQFAASRQARVEVTRAVDPVTGILGVAQRLDAELIIIGASSRGERVVGARVAAAAHRSVMVVPLRS